MNLPWFENGKFPLFLAPMAGVTDPVFRSICKDLGADVMVTEFVSADGVLKAWERNSRYTQIEESHRPVGVQLFGANGANMGEAAKVILEHDRPDFIDINCGCPVNKVVGKNGGSSLLKDLPLMASIIRAVVKAVGDEVPVTAKIRTGWDANSICALEACRMIEDEGASMVTIHGRTRNQQYSGLADWSIIDQCARELKIPVIGNGDIASGERIKEIKETMAVSGVMIGRAATSNPWIFADARYYLDHGTPPPPRSSKEKWDMVIKHAGLALESGRYGNELSTMKFMRGRLLAYSKNEPHAKQMRSEIVQVQSLAELKEVVARLAEPSVG